MTELKPEWLVRKGGYFYRPNAQGYTVSALEAGLFTERDAIRYSHPNGPTGPRDGISYHHMSEFPELAAPRTDGDVGELVGRLALVAERHGLLYQDLETVHQAADRITADQARIAELEERCAYLEGKCEGHIAVRAVLQEKG